MANVASSIAGPLITGATQIGGTLLTSSAARRQQQRQMDWNEKFWHMQNEYNSPQEQMKRLQEAGLNPNLVYGQSASGAAGHAERLTTPDMDPAGLRRIDPEGLMSTLGQYFDFDVKQAQTDKLRADATRQQEEALLTMSKAYGEGIRNARTRFDLNMAEELYQTSVDSAKEQLRKLKADTQYTLSQNERADVMLANNSAEAVERILTHRLGRQLTSAQIANVRADNELKELDKKLAKMGVRPNDPFYARAIMNFVRFYLEHYNK